MAQAPLEALERLVDDAGGEIRAERHRATGMVRFVRVRPGAIPLAGSSPEQRSVAFLERHGEVFGIEDVEAQLAPGRTRRDRYGHDHVSYGQVHAGVPVFAARLNVHFDPAGRLTAANGTIVPRIDVDVAPRLRANRAEALAVASAAVEGHGADVVASGSRLMVFRTGLVQGIPGRDHLVYEVEIGNGRDVRQWVYVDAHSGKIVERIEGIHSALDRRVHQPTFDDVVIWDEGDAYPYDTGDPANDDQVNGLIDHAASVYDLFANLSGGTHLSWDGADGTMHSIWEASFLGCPNASWNGTSTNYCNGVASDDVVSHEWAHAYTEATHGLIYQWQPGALNESYSDIFGELLDLLNGTGQDSPASVRTAGDCSTFGGAPPPSATVNTPVSIAGAYAVAGAGFNPAPPQSATGMVQVGDDGDDEAGSASTTDGCQPLIGFTPGNIALIDRGTCTFVSKVTNAENAGAVAAIIVDYDDVISAMGGGGSPGIPAVMLGNSDGAAIEAELGGGVEMTIELGAASANSLRWLMGEDSFGFGGPIRDMWNPVCQGHPGKVSDFQYRCSSGDSGGVHSNSGVPNHAFALLVDGGTYNGQTVPAIGAVKAAHIYWRAMSFYQVPDTDFADHATALAQSCSDLTGIDLADLATGLPSGQVLSAADCAAVDAAALAVELGTEPACDFQPVLAPGAPAVDCGLLAFGDDFESDPTGSWTLTNFGVFAEYTPRDWVWTASVPPGGTGSALYALDDIGLGNCIEGDDDQSGVMSAETPVIALGSAAPVLVFDHYVATESGYDGGNLKISVNGQAYQPVPSGDFLFNPYNQTLVPSGDGNTNPLAGEEAFAGSDGGVVSSTWGQSQVDLAGWAGSGDSVRLRFDFGVDGCNGLDGWYVDNLAVCTAPTAAGRVASDVEPLVLARAGGGDITLDWAASCLAADDDYEVYEGQLGDFTSHAPRTCTTGGTTDQTLQPAAGSSYYLIVPRNFGREGSYGLDGAGAERAVSTAACLEQQLGAACP